MEFCLLFNNQIGLVTNTGVRDESIQRDDNGLP
jgi:hypothetical protein